MEKELVLARSDGIPEDVAVAAVEAGRYVAVYSADDATFGVYFESRGRIVGDSIRIPFRLAGSNISNKLSMADRTSPKTFWPPRQQLSVAATDLSVAQLSGNTVAVAILSRPSSTVAGGAFLAVFDSSGVQHMLRLGNAGEYASQISLLVGEKEIIIAWHDGMMSGSRIRLAKVDRITMDVTQRSTYTNNASSNPTLAQHKGKVVMAWSESIPSSREGGRVVKIATISAALEPIQPKRVVTSRFVYSSPSLLEAEHGFALLFRDDEDGDETPEYHFLSLDEQGAVVGERQRVSTADGLRGPTLVENRDGFIGATIRSFQKNLLIGLNRLDRFGHKMGGEFQIYADKTDFVRVDIAEMGGEVGIVYAEDRRDHGRVLAGTVICSERE